MPLAMQQVLGGHDAHHLAERGLVVVHQRTLELAPVLEEFFVAGEVYLTQELGEVRRRVPRARQPFCRSGAQPLEEVGGRLGVFPSSWVAVLRQPAPSWSSASSGGWRLRVQEGGSACR